MELITVKEYCQREKITDAAARKRLRKDLESITVNNTTYIAVKNNRKDEEIKRLKNKLRNANDRIKLLKEQKQTVVNQEELIKELKEELKEYKEEAKENREKERELYEKVIGQMNLLLPSSKT